jgi:hypothetical protein
MRGSLIAIATIAAVLPAGGAVLASSTYPPMPAKARRILERDWCAQSSYARARKVPGLGRDARRNIAEAAQLVRAHRSGCRLAERAAKRRGERLPAHPPWTRRGPHGDPCPRGALSLGPHARVAAERAAAGASGRASRPVALTANQTGRAGQVTYACGREALRRSLIVSLTLTAYLPSSSLSERDVAVARFPRYGWRVWLLLH